MFFQNAIGSLPVAPLQLSMWWAVVAAMTGFMEPQTGTGFGIHFGWTFLFLFHITRCTLSYIVYIFRETIDHSGLPSTSILAFTRTSPCCNWFQKFIQPHDDNYHLLHHLLPKIPMSNLHQAHEWLVEQVPVYADANRK